MLKWFKDLLQGMFSLIQGLWVTGKHLFREPVTVQYPEIPVKTLLPSRYRGFLKVNLSQCVSCQLCKITCPISCITIEDTKGAKTMVQLSNGKTLPKMKYPIRFEIDLSKCMFCGLCTEVCPTQAIHHTPEFEGSEFDVSHLTYSYVQPQDLQWAKEKEKELQKI